MGKLKSALPVAQAVHRLCRLGGMPAPRWLAAAERSVFVCLFFYRSIEDETAAAAAGGSLVAFLRAPRLFFGFFFLHKSDKRTSTLLLSARKK